MANMAKDLSDYINGFDLSRQSYETHPGSEIRNLQPHYTNAYYKRARTCYLGEGYQVGSDTDTIDAEYNYSDRLVQWHGYNKSKAARAKAESSGHNNRCAAFLEIYLRVLLDKPTLRLLHIMAGFNLATGYPYQVYGYVTDTTDGDE